MGHLKFHCQMSGEKANLMSMRFVQGLISAILNFQSIGDHPNVNMPYCHKMHVPIKPGQCLESLKV